MKAEELMIGYLAAVSILIGILNHQKKKANTVMLIAMSLPFITFMVIAIITKQILNRVNKKN